MLTGEKKWGLRRVLSPAWQACPMSGRPMDSPDDSFDNREKNEASDPVAPTPPSSVLRPPPHRQSLFIHVLQYSPYSPARARRAGGRDGIIAKPGVKMRIFLLPPRAAPASCPPHLTPQSLLPSPPPPLSPPFSFPNLRRHHVGIRRGELSIHKGKVGKQGESGGFVSGSCWIWRGEEEEEVGKRPTPTQPALPWRRRREGSHFGVLMNRERGEEKGSRRRGGERTTLASQSSMHARSFHYQHSIAIYG